MDRPMNLKIIEEMEEPELRKPNEPGLRCQTPASSRSMSASGLLPIKLAHGEFRHLHNWSIRLYRLFRPL